MSITGDIKNNLRKLRSELHHISYNDSPDYSRLLAGDPSCFLDILYFTVFSFNHKLPSHLASTGHMITGLKDEKFMNALYKIMRDLFKYSSALKVRQFFSKGFAERKIITTCEVIHAIRTRFPLKQRARKRAATNRSISVVPAQSTLQENNEGIINLHPEPPQPIAVRHQIGDAPTAPIAHLQNIVHDTTTLEEFETAETSSSLEEVDESQNGDAATAPIAHLQTTGHDTATLEEFKTAETSATLQEEVHASQNDSEVEQHQDNKIYRELQGRFDTMEAFVSRLQEKIENTASNDINKDNLSDSVDCLKSEIQQIKSDNEKETLQHLQQIEELKAQIDVLTSRVVFLENATPKSTVCGESLICKVRSLNLHEKCELGKADKENSSPLHVSVIDTPEQSTKSYRSREAKLLKSLEETRQLLGLTGNKNALRSFVNAGVNQKTTPEESTINSETQENG